MQEVVLSREVAREVLRCMIISTRELAKIKAIDAGKALNISQPVYTRFELPKRDESGNQLPGGQRLPDWDKLVEMMQLFNAADRLPILEEIWRVAKRGSAGGHHTIGLIDQFAIRVALEPHARCIDSYEAHSFPGLLQDPTTAEALIRRGMATWPDFDAERALKIRLARPQILTRPERPVRYTCYLDESILYRMVVGRWDFIRQLQHVLTMSMLPNVITRIVPMDLADSGHPGAVTPAAGSLTLLRFTEQWVAGYTENGMAAHFHETPAQVQYCGRVMGQYELLALTEEQSRERIRRRINELEAQQE